MEIQPVSTPTTPHSPSSTSSTLSSHRRNPNPNSNPNESNNNNNNSSSDANPVHSWWESISKARSRIQSLSSFLPATTTAAANASFSLSSLADSDRPALALLESPDAYVAVSAFLSRPTSGSGDDPLCQWLYETYQSSDLDLRLVVLSFLPLLSGLYLSRVIASGTHSLAGFEAVLLSIYAAETKARAGKPVTISIPDLSQPSLYHTPKQNILTGSRQQQQKVSTVPVVGVVFPPLEPQIAVKSTKRACIVGIALDCYYKKISLMPSRSKLDICDFASAWAGQDCSCRYELDEDAILKPSSSDSTCSDVRVFSEDEKVAIRNNMSDMGKLTIGNSPVRQLNGNNGEVVESSNSSGSRRGTRIPLPWELLQPMLKIVGHCLLGPSNTQDVRDAAAASVRSIYARASHDLLPQAILASRSLIQLDKSSRASGKEMTLPTSSASNPNTPSKPRKPEVFLVSK